MAAVALAAAAIASFRGVLPVPELDRASIATLAGCAGLTVWAGVTTVWSIAGDDSWSWLDRGLVYSSLLALGLLVGMLAHGPSVLAWLLTGVVGAAMGWALLGVAVPALFEDGDRIARLREPVGYWNALALLADTGIVLGAWTAMRGSRWARAAGAGLVFASALALLLTQSRAGLLGAAAVAALWLWLSPRRLESAVGLALAAIPAIAVGGWTFTRPALVEDGAGRAARVDDGRVFAGLALAGLAVSVALALRVPTAELVARRRRAVVRALVACVAAIALLGAAGLVAKVGNPFAWATSQISGGECKNDPDRFVELCANNRLAWWGEALELARDHPVGGTGAGTFAIARLRVRDDATPAPQPHSVPLQLLADTGIVGLLLGALVVAGTIGGTRGCLRRAGPEIRPACVALAAFPVAYAVHAIVDYDLDFLAVSAPGLVALGALLAAGRPPRRLRAGVPGTIAVLAVLAATIGLLALPALSDRAATGAIVAADEGRLAEARASADRAHALDPLSLEALSAQASVAEKAGNLRLAETRFVQATKLQPEDPEPWLALGRFHFIETGDLCAAYHAFNEAYTLDPKSSRWVPGGPLDVSRDAVNDGACE